MEKEYSLLDLRKSNYNMFKNYFNILFIIIINICIRGIIVLPFVLFINIKSFKYVFLLPVLLYLLIVPIFKASFARYMNMISNNVKNNFLHTFSFRYYLNDLYFYIKTIIKNTLFFIPLIIFAIYLFIYFHNINKMDLITKFSFTNYSFLSLQNFINNIIIVILLSFIGFIAIGYNSVCRFLYYDQKNYLKESSYYKIKFFNEWHIKRFFYSIIVLFINLFIFSVLYFLYLDKYTSSVELIDISKFIIDYKIIFIVSIISLLVLPIKKIMNVYFANLLKYKSEIKKIEIR